MPLHDPDPEDPMKLVGIQLPLGDDAVLQAKAECFVEEFLRLGHPPEAVLEIFQNPEYVGAHELYRKLGEERIREMLVQFRGAFYQSKIQSPDQSDGDESDR